MRKWIHSTLGLGILICLIETRTNASWKEGGAERSKVKKGAGKRS